MKNTLYEIILKYLADHGRAGDVVEYVSSRGSREDIHGVYRSAVYRSNDLMFVFRGEGAYGSGGKETLTVYQFSKEIDISKEG